MSSMGLTKQEIDAVLGSPGRLSTALRILIHIAQTPGGATADECAEALGLQHQNCSPRFTELEKSGCIRPTGNKRKTRFGGQARVCAMAPKANFKLYVAQVKYNSRNKYTKVLSATDATILAISKEFVEKYSKNLTKEKKAKLITKLIYNLEQMHGQD